jgi:hypothetical protein
MSNILSKSKNLYVVHTDGASLTQKENALIAHGLSLKINSIVLTYPTLDAEDREHLLFNIVNQVKLQLNKDRHLS